VTLDSPANFGSVVSDAAAQYAQGDTVDVSFVSGYPGNDTRAMQAYFYAEKQNSKGGWDVVATDGQPQFTFLWNSSPSLVNTELGMSGASTAEGLWKIPLNTPPGTYRLRHEGVERLSSSQPAQAYEGLSSPFKIVGTPAACP
jgi:neutral ceramidase